MAMNQGQSQSDFILEVAGCFEPGGALSKATADLFPGIVSVLLLSL